MILYKSKICDICRKVVAVKYGLLLYTTKNPYVTMRYDEPVTYDDCECSTVKTKLHICKECFDKLKNAEVPDNDGL
jgi:hypothetical protein